MRDFGYLAGIGLWLAWLVMLGLKLTGLADLPWPLVFSPLWVPAVIAVAGSGLALAWLLGEIAVKRAKTRW